jgi:prepilin-type N-terminal cleavage/methylation domain-containing protein
MFEANFFHQESSMKNQKSRIKDQTSPRGFTIVECLIGLAISAVLLTAVAVAFNASIINYRENEDMFWTMNNARQALARMTSEIRVAGYLDEVAMPPVWYGVSLSDPNNMCTFRTADHELRRFEFRNATYSNPACRNKLYLVKPATNEEYVLCENVINAIFTRTPCSDPVHGDARSVQISLTVRSGQSQRTLAAAAVVRRIPEAYL